MGGRGQRSPSSGADRPDRRFRAYERKSFDRDRCLLCGACLSQCPVLQLPEPQAREEIASLPAYLEDPRYTRPSTDKVLKHCTSCFTCNQVCPNDCRPANLILDIWHRQYQREGLPVRARFFLPHSRPSFRTCVLDRLPENEKAAVQSWQRLSPAETIFYPGCNIVSSPYLTFSKLFEELDIRGGLDYCCGEMYFRMGLYEQVEQVARRMSVYFRTLGAKKVYLLCTAGLNLFTHVLPQFGADFTGIEFVSYLKVLHEKLVSGVWPIVRRFDGQTVTVQDACHAKCYEADYAMWPRRILEFLGFTIVEAEQSGDGMLCCGIGGGFSHEAAYAKGAMIGSQRRCLRNAVDAATDCIGVYCAGCLEMLSVAKYVYPSTKPIYHVVELIQQAIGETPRRRQRRIAFDFLRGALLQQERGRKRFFIPPIEET